MLQRQAPLLSRQRRRTSVAPSPPAEGGSGIEAGDRRVASQVLANGPAKPAAAVAMDHPNPFPARRQSPIEVGVEGVEGRLDQLADQEQLRFHRGRGRRPDPDPAARRRFYARYRQKIGSGRPDPLAADQHRRLVAA